MRTEIVYRELVPDQVARFVERGYRPRQFFPHRIYALPKCGPDAVKLTRSMVGRLRRPRYWTLLVHGTSPETVHFHEVGAVDALVYILGSCLAVDLLAPDEVVCSSLPMGTGTVECAHGTLPLPAPAVAALLPGVPVYAAGIDKVFHLEGSLQGWIQGGHPIEKGGPERARW